MWRAREKRSYYLMSSAGAGIGYALATVGTDLPNLEKTVVAIALLFWSLSFIYGLRALRLHQREMHLNQGAIQFFRDVPQPAKGVAEEIVNEDAEKLGPKVRWNHGLQVVLLLAGAITFAAFKLEVIELFLCIEGNS